MDEDSVRPGSSRGWPHFSGSDRREHETGVISSVGRVVEAAEATAELFDFIQWQFWFTDADSRGVDILECVAGVTMLIFIVVWTGGGGLDVG